MKASLEDKVRRRAGDRCEYCLMPQSALRFTHPVDHIIARQHGGKDTESNLALACIRCNLYKGPNLAGIDPASKEMVRLFHPRRDRWEDHFRWRGPRLIGKTDIGRATIRVLAMNGEGWIAVRRALIAEGVFPPS
jgi:hypothetical protein